MKTKYVCNTYTHTHTHTQWVAGDIAEKTPLSEQFRAALSNAGTVPSWHPGDSTRGAE